MENHLTRFKLSKKNNKVDKVIKLLFKKLVNKVI